MLIEVQGNLFERGKRERSTWFVQSISRDLAMGAGIAVQFNNEFNIRNLAHSRWSTLSVDVKNNIKCLRIGKVFNLITKEKYFNKPTLQTMTESLVALKGNIETLLRSGKEINEVRLPLIGCGLDRLNWEDVKPVLIEHVVDKLPNDIVFKVYYLREEDLHGRKTKKEKTE